MDLPADPDAAAAEPAAVPLLIVSATFVVAVSQETASREASAALLRPAGASEPRPPPSERVDTQRNRVRAAAAIEAAALAGEQDRAAEGLRLLSEASAFIRTSYTAASPATNTLSRDLTEMTRVLERTSLEAAGFAHSGGSAIMRSLGAAHRTQRNNFSSPSAYMYTTVAQNSMLCTSDMGGQLSTDVAAASTRLSSGGAP